MVSGPPPLGRGRPVSRADHVCLSRRGVLGAGITLAAAPFALQALVNPAQGVADERQLVGVSEPSTIQTASSDNSAAPSVAVDEHLTFPNLLAGIGSETLV